MDTQLASTAQALSEKILALLRAEQFGRVTKAAQNAQKKFPKEAIFANLAGMVAGRIRKRARGGRTLSQSILIEPTK